MKILLPSLAIAFALTPFAAPAAPKVTTAAGPTPADISGAVGSFRTDIGRGGVGNTTNGPFATGFRNINWDATADAAAAPSLMPADFFNNNVKRGAVFTAPGGVQVSAATGNPTNTAVRFGNLDASYPVRFKAFTEQRIFAAAGGTVIDTAFFVPGSPDTPATVNGFGAVFCDVDLPNISGIECFDAAGRSLGKFFAPVADNGLSFVGVFFQDGERVARVRLTLGNLPLGPGNVDTATLDVVATDDFMYGEPLPLTTNATLVNVSQRALIGTGDNVGITGFIVGGTQPKTVLVRVAGPALAGLGVGNALADPQFSLLSSAGQVVVTNDNWGNNPDIVQAAARVGAFPFAAGSTDAAAIAVLSPGTYVIITSGVTPTPGIALTEVYELK